MKKIPFSTAQKDSIVSFLLVQLFALVFVAILVYLFSVGSESISQKNVIVHKENKITLER